MEKIVNLSSLYNTKGFSWSKQNIEGELQFDNLPGERFPNNKCISIQNVPFFFPKTDSNTFDMISCEGQIIQISCTKSFNTAYILGFARFGNYLDYINHIYEDGSKIEDELGFTRLRFEPNPLFGEQVISFVNQDLAESEAKIYLQKIKLCESRLLESIILPENPYIYILSMTLL